MMQSLLNHNLVKIAMNFGKLAVDQATKLAIWGVPAAIGGAWMVYPALPASWKF